MKKKKFSTSSKGFFFGKTFYLGKLVFNITLSILNILPWFFLYLIVLILRFNSCNWFLLWFQRFKNDRVRNCKKHTFSKRNKKIYNKKDYIWKVKVDFVKTILMYVLTSALRVCRKNVLAHYKGQNHVKRYGKDIIRFVWEKRSCSECKSIVI